MSRRLPRDPKTIGSFAELREKYSQLYDLLDEKTRQLSATSSTLKSRTHEVRGTKADLKKAKSEVALISKKAAAQKSFRETSGWSAAAIGSVTLIWAGFGEYGFPGPKWLFEHDVFYGAVCWAATSIFAWAAKGFYGAD